MGGIHHQRKPYGATVVCFSFCFLGLKVGSDMEGRKEGNVLFNDALNIFYLRLYGVGHMVKDHSDSEKGNPLPPQCHMGYSFRLAARVLLYAPSNRQGSTYHGLCYTIRGALAGTRNSSMKDRSDNPSHHELITEVLGSDN